MKTYQLVIVGGGPAAAAAAIHARQRGMSVAIIERNSQVPSYKPGETLHPGIESLLKQLGVLPEVKKANFLRHEGIWVAWDKPLEFKRFKENEAWCGFQAVRETFDTILLNQAKQLGADLYLGYKPQYIKLGNNSQHTLTVLDSVENDYHIGAAYLIDASGAWGWLKRQLGVTNRSMSDRYVVKYGYVEGNYPDVDLNPTLRADTFGWTWTARLSDHLFQWTRLYFDKENSEADMIPDVFKQGTHLTKVLGADVTWQIASTLANDSYFAVGDAAFVLDPASSHGVLKAIMSGIRAGDFIYHVLTGNCQASVAHNTYSDWMEEWFAYDVDKLSTMYRSMNYI